jgi:hypothetical protein
MHNDDPIMAGEDFARPEDLALEAEEMIESDGLEPEPDVFELELDGEVHSLPSSLKGAFLRQADYTRKTQELAEHRRALEAERQAVSDERRASRGASGDRATLHALDAQLEAFEDIDWESLDQSDPRRARSLWASYQETSSLRDQFAYALSHHEAREELTAAREAAEAMAATGAQLREQIDGWSPEVAAKLVEYGQAFGVTLEELAQAADPRLWKLLHKAWQADEASAGEAQAQTRQVRPAVTVAGGGATGSGVRDELGTKEWMRRRNDQMAKGR